MERLELVEMVRCFGLSSWSQYLLLLVVWLLLWQLSLVLLLLLLLLLLLPVLMELVSK